MSKLRHWKEHWDPHADLMFLKHLTIMGEKKKRGDPVTQEIRNKLGINRLRRWWDAGYLALSDSPQAPAKTDGPVRDCGKGWFEVTFPDGTKKKVRRKELKAILLDVDSEKLRKELEADG
jgi:hypothetical protein